MVHTSRTLVVGASVAVAAGAALYASTVDSGADEQDASLPLAATNYVLGDDLDTGHVYATGDEGPEVSAAGNGAYELDGQTYAAADLPLDRQVSLEAFFFAWNAFYPESETPSRPDRRRR